MLTLVQNINPNQAANPDQGGDASLWIDMNKS